MVINSGLNFTKAKGCEFLRILDGYKAYGGKSMATRPYMIL